MSRDPVSKQTKTKKKKTSQILMLIIKSLTGVWNDLIVTK